MSLYGVSGSYSSSYDLSNELRKKELERQIEENELELEELEDDETTEKARLESEISKCETQLNDIERDNNSEISESEKKRRFDSFECETCKNRRYKDESDDSGVSFQTATHVDPSAADSAVRSHENEHVARNRTKAENNGQKIVSQSVTIHKSICPECGRTYTSGGVTRTTTKADESSKYTVGDIELEGEAVGNIMDIVA
ncbi:MAG: hypothetical protein LUI05_03175 [Oscillospiraceae bacterium]|nr:hypothetical protein [Oscillospiraceae bacterium]